MSRPKLFLLNALALAALALWLVWQQRAIQALSRENAVLRDNAAQGLPPLDPTQEHLLREDMFEAFLIAAQVEWFLSQTAEVPAAALLRTVPIVACAPLGQVMSSTCPGRKRSLALALMVICVALSKPPASK